MRSSLRDVKLLEYTTYGADRHRRFIVGERICEPLRAFRQALPVIRHHHEKMSGSGYPDGLKGNDIPTAARIVTTVNVYDALTAGRPYRWGLLPKAALAIMQEEVQKRWRDGRVADVLAHLVVGRYGSGRSHPAGRIDSG